MKPYVEKIETEAKFAEKSWGTYTVVDVQPGAMTVKVSMKPGESMSYHCHYHRNEIWMVVSGTGVVIIDDQKKNVKSGDVVMIKSECKHTVKAISQLDIVEVQIGQEISVEDKEKYMLE